MCVSGEMGRGAERMVSDETEQPSRCESMKDFAYQNQRLRFHLVYSGDVCEESWGRDGDDQISVLK